MTVKEAIEQIKKGGSFEDLKEAIETLEDMEKVISTPICEDCEPHDLQEAKIKLRWMSDECNRIQKNLIENVIRLNKEYNALYDKYIEKLTRKELESEEQ